MLSDFYKVLIVEAGFLAIMARPAAGEWIDDEFRDLARAGIDVIVSLLEPDETYEVGLEKEKEYCEKYGIEFLSYPIRDRAIPKSASEIAQLSKQLYKLIHSGKGVAIHCRAGIGRTGMIAASVLVQAGYNVEDAFSLISDTRGIPVPDTEEQYNWVINNQDKIVET